MDLHFKKSFTKCYRKLSDQEKQKVDLALIKFQDEPHHPLLRNHPLNGSLEGQRAISAGFDLRILYREEDEHAVVYLLKTGTHNHSV